MAVINIPLQDISLFEIIYVEIVKNRDTLIIQIEQNIFMKKILILKSRNLTWQNG